MSPKRNSRHRLMGSAAGETADIGIRINSPIKMIEEIGTAIRLAGRNNNGI
jgi:hypothetical protein